MSVLAAQETNMKYIDLLHEGCMVRYKQLKLKSRRKNGAIVLRSASWPV